MDKLTVLYPGTFDPVTNGHLDIIERASKLYDRIFVTIMTHPTKKTLFTLEERLDLLWRTTAHLNNVSVSHYEGLSVEYCRVIGGKAIIRGLRAQMDFEYEFQMSAANQHLDPDIEMVFMMTRQSLAFVSSSVVKEMASYHGRLDGVVPPIVAEALAAKYRR